jgi:outer membrane protein OmpA-like peptidoglycan-associated protein
MTKVLFSVPFASGSTKLNNAAKSGIADAVSQLADEPLVILDAYADPSGDDGLNLALTTARAAAVRSHMVSLGYPLHKLLQRARGERIFERANLAKQALPSRRVEIIALS